MAAVALRRNLTHHAVVLTLAKSRMARVAPAWLAHERCATRSVGFDVARYAGRSGILTADLHLRHGTQRDHAFVLDLGRRTSPDSVSAFRDAPREAIETSYDRLVEFVTDRSHVLLIAETDLDGPLGFVLMLDEIPDEVTSLPQAFVAYMAVEPGARRHGVGARLLRGAEDAARVRGLPNLALMVTEDNLAARELYAQAGFATERRLLCKRL